MHERTRILVRHWTEARVPRRQNASGGLTDVQNRRHRSVGIAVKFCYFSALFFPQIAEDYGTAIDSTIYRSLVTLLSAREMKFWQQERQESREARSRGALSHVAGWLGSKKKCTRPRPRPADETFLLLSLSCACLWRVCGVLACVCVLCVGTCRGLKTFIIFSKPALATNTKIKRSEAPK